MIMLPVANLQEVEAAAKREGRPMPDYQVCVGAEAAPNSVAAARSGRHPRATPSMHLSLF